MGIDPNFQYLPAKFTFVPISDAKIDRAIRRLNPFKAPGLNGISNAVLIPTPRPNILFNIHPQDVSTGMEAVQDSGTIEAREDRQHHT
jgi:hypothetical protein